MNEATKPAAEVHPNGLIGNYFVSFAGHIVATGLPEQDAREYADELNQVSARHDVAYQAIVIAEEPR